MVCAIVSFIPEGVFYLPGYGFQKNPKHRYHRPRRPRQDHARGRADPAVAHQTANRTRNAGADFGFERFGAGAGDYDFFKERLDRMERF